MNEIVHDRIANAVRRSASAVRMVRHIEGRAHNPPINPTEAWEIIQSLTDAVEHLAAAMQTLAVSEASPE